MHCKPQPGYGRSFSLRSHAEALTGVGLVAMALVYPWLILGPPWPGSCNLQITMTMEGNVLASILFRNETSLSYVARYKLKIKKKKTERKEMEGETEKRENNE